VFIATFTVVFNVMLTVEVVFHTEYMVYILYNYIVYIYMVYILYNYILYIYLYNYIVYIYQSGIYISVLGPVVQSRVI